MLGGFVAGRAKQPLLALDDDEAEKITTASLNVARHYDVPVSPVTQSWIALAMTIGAIYSAKIAAIRLAASLAEDRPANA